MATRGPARRSGRQERFFIEYERCGDGRQAAMLAGYSERAAGSVSRRLLEAKQPDNHAQAGKATHAEHAQETGQAEPSGGSAESAQPDSEIIHVTRDMVMSGLHREAVSEGKESSQTCRLKAWELLAKALGMFGQAAGSSEGDEPLTVRFDIRLDSQDEAAAGTDAGRHARQAAEPGFPDTKHGVQGPVAPGRSEPEGGRRPLSDISPSATGGAR